MYWLLENRATVILRILAIQFSSTHRPFSLIAWYMASGATSISPGHSTNPS